VAVSQRPRATKVAGLRTWNELGRRVRRGEKGIMILAPLIGKDKKSCNHVTDEQLTEAKSDSDSRLLGFRAVYVFDVAQTEGKELPEPTTVKGDVGDKLEKLVIFTKDRGIKLEYSDSIAPAKGMSYGGLIRILPGMEPAEEFSTLVHELIHKTERRTLITKTVKETEAEAVAFIVSHAIGLETGTTSSDYIQLYHGNAKLLTESLEVVQRTAAIILGAISPEDVEITKAAVSEVRQ